MDSHPSAVQRSLTGAIQILAVILGAGTLLLGFLGTALIAFGEFSASVPLVADVGQAPDLGEIQGYAWVFYDSVRVVVSDPPGLARLLTWSGYAVIATVVLLGCLVGFILARRLRTGRPFSRFASNALLLLGALAVIAAFVSPALFLEATATAVSDLGLRTSPAQGFALYEATEGLAELRLERFPAPGVVLRETNWVLAGVGGILVVISFAFRRGHALQSDVEGLV